MATQEKKKTAEGREAARARAKAHLSDLIPPAEIPFADAIEMAISEAIIRKELTPKQTLEFTIGATRLRIEEAKLAEMKKQTAAMEQIAHNLDMMRAER